MLRDAGWIVARGWRGELWLGYRQGFEALDTGVGAPGRDATPCARLGLRDAAAAAERGGGGGAPRADGGGAPDAPDASDAFACAGADARATRRAYHAASLAWHPDRWAAYPAYAPHAQAAFEHVADACSNSIPG